MKDRFKKLAGRLKTFVEVWKIWLFFTALLFGTNGAQMYANSEPEPVNSVVSAPEPVREPTKTIIIHKSDNEYVDRKLEEHKTGAQH